MISEEIVSIVSSTGSGNIALGQNAGGSVTTASNVTCIGASGANVDNSCFIGRIYFNVQPHCWDRSGFGHHNQHRQTWPR
jgi:hypothetical protein